MATVDEFIVCNADKAKGLQPSGFSLLAILMILVTPFSLCNSSIDFPG